jgi:hypothetical protein
VADGVLEGGVVAVVVLGCGTGVGVVAGGWALPATPGLFVAGPFIFTCG